MTMSLWAWTDLVAAARGVAERVPAAAISGFSIDTRTIKPGEVFVALTDARDGHAFVSNAFKAGAAAALVRRDYARQDGDGALIRVEDTLRALEHIGIAARARLAPEARVVAITGSAGKTGTKEMLRACLAPLGPTHAPEKSFNNHWGVPLTLARMPAETRYAVIEIGMNHAGEITPLTKMARPHVAIVTNVLPVHVGNFSDGEIGVANAKSEIFVGLEPGGLAILPGDSRHIDLLTGVARAHADHTCTFGRGNADVRAKRIDTVEGGSLVTVTCGTREIQYRVGAPGEHLAENSLAVVAALDELVGPGDVATALAPLAAFQAPVGRGARTKLRIDGGYILLIDESYNANPASMKAALHMLADVSRTQWPRRIVVLGDMRELGDQSSRFHRDLLWHVEASGADQVFACGQYMNELFVLLDPKQRGAWAAASTELAAMVKSTMRPGDVVMVKGSLGTNMAPIVSAIRSLDADAGTAKA